MPSVYPDNDLSYREISEHAVPHDRDGYRPNPTTGTRAGHSVYLHGTTTKGSTNTVRGGAVRTWIPIQRRQAAIAALYGPRTAGANEEGVRNADTNRLSAEGPEFISRE